MLTMPGFFKPFSEFLTAVEDTTTRHDLQGLKDAVAKLQSKLPPCDSFNDLCTLNQYCDRATFKESLLKQAIISKDLEAFKYFTQDLAIDIHSDKDVYYAVLFYAVLECPEIALFMLQGNYDLNLAQSATLYGCSFTQKNEPLNSFFWDKIAQHVPEEDRAKFKTDLDQKIKETIPEELDGAVKIMAQDVQQLARYTQQLQAWISTSSTADDTLEQICASAKRHIARFEADKKEPIIECLHLEMLIKLYTQKLDPSKHTIKNDANNAIVLNILTKMGQTVSLKQRAARAHNKIIAAKIDDYFIDKFLGLAEYISPENTDKFIITWETLEKTPDYWDEAEQFYSELMSRDMGIFNLAFIEDALSLSNLPLVKYLSDKTPQLSDKIKKINLLIGAKKNHVALVESALNETAFSREDLIMAFSLAISHDHDELAEKIADKLPPQHKATTRRLAPEYKELFKRQIALQAEGHVQKYAKILDKLHKLKTALKENIQVDNRLALINKLFSIIESINDELAKQQSIPCTKTLILELLVTRLSASIMLDIDLEKEAVIVSEIVSIFTAEQVLEISDLSQFLPPKLFEEVLREIQEDAIAPLTSEDYGLFYEVKKQYAKQFDALCNKATNNEENPHFDHEEIDSSYHTGDNDDDNGDIVAQPLHVDDEAAPEAGPLDDQEADQTDVAPAIDLTKLPCFPVLKDFENYLVAEFTKDNLSQTFDPNWSKEELEKYHSNIFHTAWRYVFCKPNPWLFPGAKWAKHGASEIHPEEYERLAYFWLAVSDKNTPPIQGFTLEGRQAFFAKMLASFGREYNKDNAKGDDPTCAKAVKKRQTQLLIGHPIIEQVKDLTPEYILQLLKQHCVAQSETNKTLFADLSTLSLKELKQLDAALESWIINCGDVDRVDALILNIAMFDTNDESLLATLDELVAQLTNEFGEERLFDLEVKYQNDTYTNVSHFVEEIFNNPLRFYSADIFHFVRAQIAKLEAENAPVSPKEKDPSSAPILTSFQQQKGKKRKEKSTQGEQHKEELTSTSDQDEDAEPISKRHEAKIM